MADDSHSLESLQELHADLLALSESRLSNIERLGSQLEAHAQAFQALLDKKTCSEKSRNELRAKVHIDLGDTRYQINNEFKEVIEGVANVLKLDELEAADLCVEVQNEANTSGQPTQTCAIVRFHQRRQEVLDCLRLTLEIFWDENEDGQDSFDKDWLDAFISEVTKAQDTRDESRFIRRCLSNMKDIRTWLQNLSERASVEVFKDTSETGIQELERITYQRVSLLKQHESLGVILYYLSKKDSVQSDFELMLETLREMEIYDELLLHSLPAVFAYIAHFGGLGGPIGLEDARSLNQKLFANTSQKPWKLVYVHAAFRAWWLAEYSSWYVDDNEGSMPANQLKEESNQRQRQFTDALKDGAFDFMIALAADIKSQEWEDPARNGLRLWLQQKAPSIHRSTDTSFSDGFQEILMQQVERFIDNFITNMPNVLRKLRVDEDEQRQGSTTLNHDIEVERFLGVISFTFEGRPKAAFESFWDVQDGVLIGFMHWVCRRASTPLVSAFCEMLQTISETEECADKAHEFLLDDGPQSGYQMRRHSLTWNHIFKELIFFSKNLQGRPAIPQAFGLGGPSNDHVELEPESLLMLECYLRVIARLCGASAKARAFITTHPTFHLSEMLFQLASSSIAHRLKGCAFTTLRSLLSDKNKEAGEYVWSALDIWVSGGYSPGSNMGKPTVPIQVSAASIDRILRSLGNGFEEPNAFVQLLCALISPYAEEIQTQLYDGLPFPENLGASSRMPGIEPYVDFALGHVFALQTTEITDPKHLRLLQLSCLDFISTALDTFNEDLVIFGNRTSIAVDVAIRASDLKNYVLLHPFARVMEWLFNEKVMDALFAAIHHDAAVVGNASQDSPIIQVILRGIHAVTTIMDLQATYLDIIRPLVRLEKPHQRQVISNSAFASFEDGILSHLSIIADLGLYCGAGQPELVIASLKLLRKLSSSTKLASATVTGMGRIANQNKAIAALEVNNASDTIAKSLLHEMKKPIDINKGIHDSAYVIQLSILDFLAACLKASPGQPTIAHLLLGFSCRGSIIDVDPESSFSQRLSLFHYILEIAVTCPVGEEINTVSSHLVTIKHKALQVLQQLWHSPLSSAVVLDEMRDVEAAISLFGKQIPITNETLFDGRLAGDLQLFMPSANACISHFLGQRAKTFQYVSAELRHIAQINLPSRKARLFNTLFGSTEEDGSQVLHSSVYDLFDFIELDFSYDAAVPSPAWVAGLDLSICLENKGDSGYTYNLEKLKQVLLLRRAEVVKRGLLEDIPKISEDIDAIYAFYAIDNEIKVYAASRLQLLRSWSQLMLVMVKTTDLHGPQKIQAMLQILQAILPSLENRVDNIDETTELSQLARTLIFSIDFNSDSFKQGDIGDLVSDKLFHLFQVSLRAIGPLGNQPDLKEVFYSISYRYLTGMSDITGISKARRRHSIHTLKAAGERFIDLVCDDAHSGEPMCRISALLLLSALVKMAEAEDSKYIVEALIRLNFITILVESIQFLADDLRSTAREDVNLQLSYCHAKLSLLLQVSQTRFGAATVLNAGLFHSVQASGLFSMDPDLGVDIDVLDAINKHYRLLAAIMRVICAAVLSRGAQNQQTIDIGRRFLTENKLSIMAVLKKSAGIGTGADVVEGEIYELADAYMLLMSVTGFLDLEDTNQKRPKVKMFT